VKRPVPELNVPLSVKLPDRLIAGLLVVPAYVTPESVRFPAMVVVPAAGVFVPEPLRTRLP